MKIIECPRDAMQGIPEFIPTETKIAYINQLLKIGFHTIDFGSFVSPKAIPQMIDTTQVLEGLHLEDTRSKLLAIVANLRGAVEALAYEEIDYLGFPLSLSETFQKKNTNRTIAEAMIMVAEIQNECSKNNRQLVTYLSMGFGNPYNDPYDPEIVLKFTEKLVSYGIITISLADTIGISNPDNISYLFQTLIPEFQQVEFGAHLHSLPAEVEEKVTAAYHAGCRRFDGALKGYGGCPMAEDQLVGNIPTERLLDHLNYLGANLQLDKEAFSQAISLTSDVFPIS
jgi:hydroxymethylglutaryl-CoA lyase